jgi:hypothetical protein
MRVRMRVRNVSQSRDVMRRRGDIEERSLERACRHRRCGLGQHREKE